MNLLKSMSYINFTIFYSDIPSSFEAQNITQLNANDTKESITLAANSRVDQLPKDISQVIDVTEQKTSLQNVVDNSQNVAHDDLAIKTIENAMIAPIEPQKDLEAASPTKSQPVRKISRFLVSPAILTVANEKIVQNTCIEDTIQSPPPMMVQLPNAPNLVAGDLNQITPQNQVIYSLLSYDN